MSDPIKLKVENLTSSINTINVKRKIVVENLTSSIQVNLETITNLVLPGIFDDTFDATFN